MRRLFNLVLSWLLNPRFAIVTLFIAFAFGVIYSYIRDDAIEHVAIVIFIISTVIGIPSISSFLMQCKQRLKMQRFPVTWGEILPQFVPLVERVGVKLNSKRPMGIACNLLNAYSRPDKSIVIGGLLLEKFDETSCNAIVAHELAHLKKNHFKRYYIAWLLIFITGYLAIALRSADIEVVVILTISFISLLLAVTFIMFRYSEYEADDIASSYVNPRDLISAYLKTKESNIKDKDATYLLLCQSDSVDYKDE